MKERCVVVPALGRNAALPDLLVRRLAGETLVERAVNTARSVAPCEDVVVLTDGQDIALICERAGVACRRALASRSAGADADAAELRDLLMDLARDYEHCVILSPVCPLVTWADVEDAWKRYGESGADGLVTVTAARRRVWDPHAGALLERLLRDDGGERSLALESRALTILRSEAVCRAARAGDGAVVGRVEPWHLNDRALEIQSWQDWWICERLLRRRNVVFVVAGWPAIGMGHVYRALMLAHEITDHAVAFVCTRESELAVESVARRDYRMVRQGGEDLAETILRLRPDLVVNDILNTDPACMARLREAGCRIVNFEDDGPGAELAHLVINALYEGVPRTERLRCGADWFCLRDEFVGARRNDLRPEVKTVLVTFGGTDAADCSRRVLDIVEPICRKRGIAIRVVAGPGYAHKDAMRARIAELDNPLVEFAWATNVMSRMMEGADLAVCAAGRTVHELAHMRVPGIVLAQHDREARHAFAREDNGFVFLGLASRTTDADIRAAFLDLLDNAERRAALFARQDARDFTRNKARVIRLMLDLIEPAEAAS